MSNYLGASITIGISENFEWLERFIDSIYQGEEIYVAKLLRADAHRYFKQELQEFREKECASHKPHPILWISWVVEGTAYDVSITTHPGYLRWTMHFDSTRQYKNSEEYFTDYEYYILLLLETMKDFPIFEVATYDDYIDHEEWYTIDGNRWNFKIQDPQPEYNFQMLDIVVDAQLISSLINDLTSATACKGYSFIPEDGPFIEIVFDSATDKVSFSQRWKYICENTSYSVYILPCAGCIRLLFKTLPKKESPSISLLMQHALVLTTNNFLEQVRTFDSRYNYFFTQKLVQEKLK